MKIYYLIISLILVTVYFLLKKKEHFSTQNYNLDYIKQNPVLKKLYNQCKEYGLSNNFCTKQISLYLNTIDINSLKSTNSIELSNLPLLENIASYIVRFKQEANNCIRSNSKYHCNRRINAYVNNIRHKTDEYIKELKNVMTKYIDSLRR